MSNCPSKQNGHGSCGVQGNIHQTVIQQDPKYCPVFQEDGQITLTDCEGATRSFLPGTSSPPTISYADGILSISQGGVSNSYPLAGDVVLDAFGNPIGYYLPV